MKLARSRGRDIVGRRTRSIFGAGLALWLVQTLLLASGTLLLMFCSAGWVDLFEQQRLVRNFMANPVEMVLVEAFGVLCIVVGITRFSNKDDSFLDTAWGRYLPLFIEVCLILLFICGLFRPWWLFR
jgi:hypothetical protein